MSVFRSDDGREIDEDDLRLVVELADCPSHSYGGVGEATTRILAALDPKPRKLTGAELAVAHGIVDGPDGEDWLQAQLRAPDVLERIEEEGYEVVARVPSEEELAKPAPTCGAYLEPTHHDDGIYTCALPPGHHPFLTKTTHVSRPGETLIDVTCYDCSRTFYNEIHSSGHMPSADSWRDNDH